MPKPRRSAADVLGVLLAGAVSALVSGRAPLAAPHPASLQVSFPTLLATRPAPRLKADEKTKVPKPPPPRTKDSGEKKDEKGNETKEDDSVSALDCVSNCFSFGDALLTAALRP